jgi:replicative DNA helicase
MESNYQHINEDFLSEFLKACLTSKSILEIGIKHLQYHYIISEAHKKIFEKVVQVYQLQNTLPTIGSLSQEFVKNENVLKLLIQLKTINVADKKDILLQTFETFLKKVKFQDLYKKTGILYNEGHQDKAIDLLYKESVKIANFTIKDQYYTTVFSSFQQRQIERQSKERERTGYEKVPFSIHCLDYDTRGGMNKGTSHCLMARSGGGKSTALRWIGMSAARMGMRVVHFQGEGSEQETLDAYDAGWTGTNLEEMEFGYLDSSKIKLIEKANKDIIASGGEVFVRGIENFEELYLEDCDEILDDIEKIHGPIDLIIYDYLELWKIRGKYYNSEAGERKRREDVANRITTTAVKRHAAALTATQANDIQPTTYNNPAFILTRSNISEYKGAIKPFSSFITLNQTDDEAENNIFRLYEDKFRKYRAKKTHKISASLDNSRFYDSKKSLVLFWDEKTNQPK